MADSTPPSREPRRQPADRPSHPPLAATLLMVGIVAFLLIVSVLAVI